MKHQIKVGDLVESLDHNRPNWQGAPGYEYKKVVGTVVKVTAIGVGRNQIEVIYFHAITTASYYRFDRWPLSALRPIPTDLRPGERVRLLKPSEWIKGDWFDNSDRDFFERGYKERIEEYEGEIVTFVKYGLDCPPFKAGMPEHKTIQIDTGIYYPAYAVERVVVDPAYEKEENMKEEIKIGSRVRFNLPKDTSTVWLVQEFKNAGTGWVEWSMRDILGEEGVVEEINTNKPICLVSFGHTPVTNERYIPTKFLTLVSTDYQPQPDDVVELVWPSGEVFGEYVRELIFSSGHSDMFKRGGRYIIKRVWPRHVELKGQKYYWPRKALRLVERPRKRQEPSEVQFWKIGANESPPNITPEQMAEGMEYWIKIILDKHSLDNPKFSKTAIQERLAAAIGALKWMTIARDPGKKWSTGGMTCPQCQLYKRVDEFGDVVPDCSRCPLPGCGKLRALWPRYRMAAMQYFNSSYTAPQAQQLLAEMSSAAWEIADILTRFALTGEKSG